MRKDDIVRLRHMMDAAQEALTFVQGRSRTDLDTDRQLALSLVKEVEISGHPCQRLLVPTTRPIADFRRPFVSGHTAGRTTTK